MRSIWAGAISFGMVVIPVKLYAATEQRDVAFRQVHAEDGGRVQYRRFCSIDGQEVAYSDVAKGYELATGDVVVLTDDDLKELPLATAKRIDVLHFSPAGQLDPILSNKAYYLEPEPAGVRAYALFRDALERSGRVAVAKVAIRQREALAALRVRDGVLVLETLLWPDEVRAPDFKFLDEDVDVRSQELKMAASLIDTMTEDFDPSLYKDAYREALEALVQAKIEGNEVVRPVGQAAAADKAGGPADLAETLRASVEAAKANRAKSSDKAADRSRRPSAGQDAQAPQAPRLAQEGVGVTADRPVQHWPGRLVDIGGGDQVYLAQSPWSAPGERDLVLCVHGMSGAATNWTDLIAELAPDFDCAGVDLPGSGFSAPPAKRSGYSVRALAKTIIRLIETLDRGPVHLIGNSMGGAVSIRVAAGPTGPGENAHAYLAGAAGPSAAPVDDSLPGPGAAFVGRSLVRYWARVPAENRVAGVYRTCCYDPAILHPERFAQEVAALRRLDELGYGGATLVGAARTLVAETLTPRPLSLWRAAERVQAPALVLFGSHDRLMSPALAAPAARAFKNAQVEVLSHIGHIGQMERPDLIAARFREMVAKTGMPGGGTRLTPDELTST